MSAESVRAALIAEASSWALRNPNVYRRLRLKARAAKMQGEVFSAAAIMPVIRGRATGRYCTTALHSVNAERRLADGLTMLLDGEHALAAGLAAIEHARCVPDTGTVYR